MGGGGGQGPPPPTAFLNVFGRIGSRQPELVCATFIKAHSNTPLWRNIEAPTLLPEPT
jgi:hypothetical protein